MNEPEAWQIKSSHYIHKDSSILVRLDDIELPSGISLSDQLVVECCDLVMILAFTSHHDLLLTRQYQHGIKKNTYGLPMGAINVNMDSLSSAKQVLLDITGYANGAWKKWMTISPDARVYNNTCHYFVATGLEFIKDESFAGTAQNHVLNFPPAKVLSLLKSGEILNSLDATALWRYFSEGSSEFRMASQSIH